MGELYTIEREDGDFVGESKRSLVDGVIIESIKIGAGLLVRGRESRESQFVECSEENPFPPHYFVHRHRLLIVFVGLRVHHRDNLDLIGKQAGESFASSAAGRQQARQQAGQQAGSSGSSIHVYVPS